MFALFAAFAFGAFEGGGVAARELCGGAAVEEVFDGQDLDAGKESVGGLVEARGDGFGGHVTGVA